MKTKLEVLNQLHSPVEIHKRPLYSRRLVSEWAHSKTQCLGYPEHESFGKSSNI